MSQKDDKLGPAGLPYRPCAGVMLVNGEGLIFAGQRIDSTLEAWQMPQGGIDKGESAVEAALRELGEETGLPTDAVEVVAETEGWIYYDLPEDMVGKIWKGKYGGQRQKWVLMRFIGSDNQVNIKTEHPEFHRWAWMSAEDLIDAIVPFKRDVYEKVFAAFAEHLD